jgi:hypothetical protein
MFLVLALASVVYFAQGWHRHCSCTQVCLNLQDPQIWVLGQLDEDPHDEEDDEERDDTLFHPLFTSVAATVASVAETAISVNRAVDENLGIRVRRMSFESYAPRSRTHSHTHSQCCANVT